jgi:signal transduction histidine kinase
MDVLVADLLRLSQISTDPGQVQSVSLDDIVQHALAELKPHAEGRQIQWQIGRLGVVETDPGLIHQVFVNLLSNALKYTRRQATAVIEVNKTMVDGNVTYYVRDNGVGFSMEKAGKLFTPFHRLHGGAEFEGTGIGLAVVARIIRKHGGRVWAESQPNQGATFFFCLACTAQPSSNHPA